MTARLRSMTDEQLGTALASLPVAWPSEPDLAPAVLASARSSPPQVARLPLSRSKRIALAAAAIVLLLAGAAVAAKILVDLGAVVVEVTPDRPGILPSPTAAPLGRPITADEAADLLGHELPLPAALGSPDRIWADEVSTEAGDAIRITAGWEATARLPRIRGTHLGAVLMRFEGDIEQAFKTVYEDTGVIEPAVVDGTEAFWTSGRHLLELLTSDGAVFVPVDGNVLLWKEGTYTMRLETALSKAAAIRIASSIPSGTP